MQQQQPSREMAHQTVVRGQRRFYLPRTRDLLVREPHRILGRQKSIHDQLQQPTVPHVVVPEVVPDPLLIQANLFFRCLNQQTPHGNQPNENGSLSSTPIEKISLHIGSSNSVTVTADWMRENENEDKEVEQSSSFTITADWMREKKNKDQEFEQSSSVTISVDWMREKENEDQEVEQLDLELRL
ncbi:hypothetical protein KY290_001303 [Solanum tuberosum]|uniref:Uncharacterized protein n=1 Tax=Solanum tuberosum TaxID=4113 RepID=A0ABQ7WLX0_SOLTU|nr:hypothetical protein KY290_001303 [Solanum tuberosum]